MSNPDVSPRPGQVFFSKVAFIGIGLIGASMALAMRKAGLVGKIAAASHRRETCGEVLALGICDEASTDIETVVNGADLVVLATPVGVMGDVAERMAGSLKQGAVVTDVGSVKQSVVKAVTPHLSEGIAFVPGHPIAGTEQSGPSAGSANLFQGRWCILTPDSGVAASAVTAVTAMWEALGARVATMSAEHHDLVLAITSHIPHLIAYTIVGTAAGLEDTLRQEVLQYSAGGFRDFTRIAASDPVMWRDIFLSNKEAVLEMLGRFEEDLTELRRAVRHGDGQALEAHFAKGRGLRRGALELG